MAASMKFHVALSQQSRSNAIETAMSEPKQSGAANLPDPAPLERAKGTNLEVPG